MVVQALTHMLQKLDSPPKSPVATTIATTTEQPAFPYNIAAEILAEISRSSCAQAFLLPVELESYRKVIEQPMDLQTLSIDKLPGYTCLEELFTDFNLMITNATIFNNPASHPIHVQALKVHSIFSELCLKRFGYIVPAISKRPQRKIVKPVKYQAKSVWNMDPQNGGGETALSRKRRRSFLVPTASSESSDASPTNSSARINSVLQKKSKACVDDTTIKCHGCQMSNKVKKKSIMKCTECGIKIRNTIELNLEQKNELSLRMPLLSDDDMQKAVAIVRGCISPMLCQEEVVTLDVDMLPKKVGIDLYDFVTSAMIACNEPAAVQEIVFDEDSDY